MLFRSGQTSDAAIKTSAKAKNGYRELLGAGGALAGATAVIRRPHRPPPKRTRKNAYGCERWRQRGSKPLYILYYLHQLDTKEHVGEAAAKDADAARARCRSLFNFVREAWPHIPAVASVKYVEGWHIALICAHLEAITSGRLLKLGLENRLLVNVPPGTSKSLLISVFWPAWEWTQFPHYQYITTSYREDYCTRDTGRMRDLVTSDWYQMLWGEDRRLEDGTVVQGVRMQAVGETRISNTAGGWREGGRFGPHIATGWTEVTPSDGAKVRCTSSLATRMD